MLSYETMSGNKFYEFGWRARRKHVKNMGGQQRKMSSIKKEFKLIENVDVYLNFIKIMANSKHNLVQ